MSKDLKIKLIKDQLMIKVDKAEEKTASGLYIPETAAIPKNTGIVISRGEQCTSSVKEGDRIIFRTGYGDNLKHEEYEYLVLKEDNVFGMI